MNRTATWRNWAGTVEADPARIATPTSTGEVAQIVQEARASGRRVKPIGSGHSFTGVCWTDGVQIDLGYLAGLLDVDRATGRVRVKAGTKLHDLNRLLDTVGLALPNMGDVDRQTIAGATSTGTHGTGDRFTGLSGGITAFTLVTADGEVLEVDRERHPDVFDAARVGLGGFGIITEIELACVPAFRIRAEETIEPLAQILDTSDQLMTAQDHVEWWWFPHTDRAMVKRNTRLAPGDDSGQPMSRLKAKISDEIVDNGVFELMNRAMTHRPGWVPAANRLAARVMSTRTYSDVSHKVYISPRTVRFRESEYAVPREAAVPAIRELQRWFDRTRAAVTFPLEIRYAAADDIWLSTAYERPACYIAIHQYIGHDHTELFRAFEDVMASYDGRPHWGKMHRLTATDVARLYPRFGDAMAVRDRLDPDRVFTNPYLQRVWGS